MTLDQFVAKEVDSLIKFKIYWLEQNLKHPDVYPLEFSDDNSGFWLEMYLNKPQGVY